MNTSDKIGMNVKIKRRRIKKRGRGNKK